MSTFTWGGSPTFNAHSPEYKECAIYRSQNEVWFNTDVTTGSISKLIKIIYAAIHDDKLSAYRENNNFEVIIHIDSWGGVVSAAFKFVDFIRLLKNKNIKVTTIINGCSCSAATIMAMAGDKCLITENSSAMIHEISCVVGGTHTHVISYSKHLTDMHDRLVKLYSEHRKKVFNRKFPEGGDEKILADITNKEAIETLLNTETWYNAQEYVDSYFADETI